MLESAVVDTEELPPPDRFGLWLDVIARMSAPLKVYTDHADNFTARATAIPLGPVQLIDYRYPSMDARRANSRAGSEPEVYMLALTTSGRSRITQDRQTSAFHAGDFTFYDATRAHEVAHFGDLGRTGLATSVCLVIPHDLVSLPPDKVARLFAGRLSSTDGVGVLLAQYMTRIAAHPEQYRPQDAPQLGTIALDLFTTMLGTHLDTAATVPTAVRQRAMLTRVHAFIQRHLADPRLDPAMIAAAHHMSVRSLHRLFAEEQSSVAETIRQRRLDRCRRDLMNPALQHQPAYAVGARWGFPDRAHFTRVFRYAYGVTPQAYREQQDVLGSPGVARTANPVAPVDNDGTAILKPDRR
ncbi:helix-turn-helix domain-containing protein [Micromonospora sp. CPCC 206060]|uniref:AraC-like ligand-binding domain-containing protein n=1 Tax=Micromonospora sp. CPCC 206060 TaxID=3122406 RepID=UPI002FEF5835